MLFSNFAECRSPTRCLDNMKMKSLLVILAGLLHFAGSTVTFECFNGCFCVGYDGIMRSYADEVSCINMDWERVPELDSDVERAKFIDFSDNNFVFLEDGNIGQFQYLEKLFFRRNHLDYISKGAFNSTLVYSSLVHVDFSGNHLHEVPSSFEHLDETMTRLYNLTTLILSYNEIGPTIDEYSFNGLKRLVYLDLSWNNIKYIEPRTFRYLRRLAYLDLSYNVIEVISSSLFGRLSELETFKLSGNKIAAIPGGMPGTLQYLELGENRIVNITSEHAQNLNALPNLQQLNLTYNGLRDLVPDAFLTLSKLRILDLSNNDLSYLQSDVFAGTSSLEYLFLNRNQYLHDLPNNLFINLPNLRYLVLYRCALKTFEIGTPSVSPLSARFTSSVTSETVEVDKSYAPSLEGIWLFGNPINCDCQILPLVWFINVRNITLDAKLDDIIDDETATDVLVDYLRKDGTYNGNYPMSRTYCASPFNRHNKVVGKGIMEVPESNLICPHQPFFIAVSMFMGIALFAAAIPVVFFIVFLYLCTIKVLVKYCGLRFSEDED